MRDHEKSTRAPVPWRSVRGGADPRIEEAAQLLDQARQLKAWSPSERAALLSRMAQRSQAAGLGWKAILGASLAAMVLLGVWGARRTPRRSAAVVSPVVSGWQVMALDEVGRLEIAPGAQVRVPRSLEAPRGLVRFVYLDAGRLRAQIRHRSDGHVLVVVTPHLRVVDVGTRFEVSVAKASTRVSVEEGRVRVESRSRSVEVGAGEWVSSDDPRLAAAGSAPSPSPISSPGPRSAHSRDRSEQSDLVARCAQATGVQEKESCYDRLAAGEGLVAQDALYALGLLERDEAHDGAKAMGPWLTYLRRFPEGTLAPEASVGILTELLAERRYQEALDETDYYRSHFQQGSQAAEVALIRGNLLRERFNDASGALAAFEEVLRMSPEARLKGEALFQKGVCQQALGDAASAHATWREYLAEFPAGAHASGAAALVRP